MRGRLRSLAEDDELSGGLAQAGELRYFLTHHFFWERVENVVKRQGRVAMRRELL
ncbi:MAG: hypothetical protein ACR2MC_01060 [Actinomycetota bacterium]